MATATKKARSEAAKKAARTRKRNQQKATTPRQPTGEKTTVTAKTEEKDGLTVTQRPERRTGEAEIARRPDPTRNKVADTVVSEPVTGTVPSGTESLKGKSKEVVVDAHGFPSGTKVTFHHDTAEDVARQSGHAPYSQPVARVTVSKSGELKVKLPEGHYVAAAEVEVEVPQPTGDPKKVKEYRFVGVAVS